MGNIKDSSVSVDYNMCHCSIIYYVATYLSGHKQKASGDVLPSNNCHRSIDHKDRHSTIAVIKYATQHFNLICHSLQVQSGVDMSNQKLFLF